MNTQHDNEVANSAVFHCIRLCHNLKKLDESILGGSFGDKDREKNKAIDEVIASLEQFRSNFVNENQLISDLTYLLSKVDKATILPKVENGKSQFK